MEELGKIHQLIIPFFGHNMTFNVEVIIMTWIVFIALLIFGFLAARGKRVIPGPVQVIGELFVSGLYGLTEEEMDAYTDLLQLTAADSAYEDIHEDLLTDYVPGYLGQSYAYVSYSHNVNGLWSLSCALLHNIKDRFGYLIPGCEQVRHLGSIKLDHQVRDAIFVIVTYFRWLGQRRNSVIQTDSGNIDLGYIVA